MFLCLVLFSLSLVSCKKNIEVFYEEAKEYEVYVVEDKTNKVECLALSYPVTSAESIFSLYTTYQNHIPLGYNSPASPNITLLDCQVKDKEIFFKVDNYIFLSDISLFYDVLSKTCKLYGYEEIHIIFKDSELI